LFEVLRNALWRLLPAIPVLFAPRGSSLDVGCCQQIEQYLIIRIQVAIRAVKKTDQQIFPLVFLPDTKSALLLNAQERYSVHVLSQEVGPVPVVTKPNCSESVVRKKARDLLKVIVFLLTGVKFSGIDLLQLQSFAHAEEYRPIS